MPPVTAKADESALHEAEAQDEALQDAQEAEASDKEAIEEAEKPVQIPIEINGVPDNTLFRIVEPRKGKRAERVIMLFKPPLNVPNPFSNIAKMVGVENLFKLIMEEIVHPACVEATKAARDEETGKFSLAKYAEAFVAYFVSETRGGSGIRELKKRFAALTNEVMPFIASKINPDEAREWTPDQQAYYTNKVVEWKELSAKLQAKPTARGKKGKTAAPVAKAA